MENKSVIFFDKADFITINYKDVNVLKDYASEVISKRSRYCLHSSCDDEIQEMIIAFYKKSYIRPHKHVNKTESYHIIEGELVVCFFNDRGDIIEKIFLGSYNQSKTFFYRLASDKWHSVIPISDYVVIHEVTKGPYNLNETLFPPWAPLNHENEKIEAFLNRIRTKINLTQS